VTTARRESLEPPGFTHLGRVISPDVRRSRTGHVTPRSTDLGARAVARRRPPCGRKHIMAAKPKPQSSDDAREQARRALQTSMDTRQ